MTDIYVKIAWVLPSDHSAAVQEYEILIQQGGGSSTFTAQSTFCDGSNLAVVASRYCLVPMTVLRSAPYSLQYAELVSAKLRARNAIGWSGFSPANAAGALVETEPK